MSRGCNTDSTVAGEQIFVIGGIWLVKADMPQALAGCQHRLATKPSSCRMCLVTYGSDLADASFDSSLQSRSFCTGLLGSSRIARNGRKWNKMALEKTGMSTVNAVCYSIRGPRPGLWRHAADSTRCAELLGISLLSTSLFVSMLFYHNIKTTHDALDVIIMILILCPKA